MFQDFVSKGDSFCCIKERSDDPSLGQTWLTVILSLPLAWNEMGSLEWTDEETVDRYDPETVLFQ